MRRSGAKDRLAMMRDGIDRRGALALGASCFFVAAGIGPAKAASGDAEEVSEDELNADVLSEAAVLRDPAIPVGGNPKGDITIVEFTDFQCPACRKVMPDLMSVVKEDGNIRLVLKDWPILGKVSVYAAQMSLATRYQNKFLQAHEALMAVRTKLTEQVVREALGRGGIDVARAEADLKTNEAAIKAVLSRVDQQAQAFGFRGTPSFIVGKFRIGGPLSKEHFALAVADARKAAASAR